MRPGEPPAPTPEPAGVDELRRAAYVLIDRGRSVAQTAAVLNLDRDQVRTWAQMGRW